MSRRLRIALVCQQDLGGAAHPLPAYRFWRRYFASAFAEADHELVEFTDCDWSAGLLPISSESASVWRQQTWDKAVKQLRLLHTRQPIDLFLSYLYPQQILTSALDEVRALGIPRVNFFCDNVREFQRVPPEFKPFDLHWVPEAGALSLYRSAKLPHLHLPMPCWVPNHLRQIPTEERMESVFIGTRDKTREDLFAEAFSLGLMAHLYGTGWSGDPTYSPKSVRHGRLDSLCLRQAAFIRQHGLVALARKLIQKITPPPSTDFDFSPWASPACSEVDYWSFTRESAVCLGVNRYPSFRHPWYRPGSYSRLRDIEAPMAGACYLTEWTEGIDHLFEPGREIETYKNAHELVVKSKVLLADRNRRMALRKSAQNRALSQHSISHSLQRIMLHLGL